ncbi:MAG: hypothetical protein J6V76_04880, partial [Bacteroidales bacterium]|nr:hypothetical protein [Bacteroidales bacterium]
LQLETGLKTTRTQLDKVQKSVNNLIDSRSHIITTTEENVIHDSECETAREGTSPISKNFTNICFAY